MVPPAKDDPRATKNERFDENRPTAVLAPSTPPLPPTPPAGPVSSQAGPPDAARDTERADHDRSGAGSAGSTRGSAEDGDVGPADTARAAPAIKGSHHRRRGQGSPDDDRRAALRRDGLGPRRLQPAALRMGGGGGDSEGSSTIATMTTPTAGSQASASAGGSNASNAAPPARDALGDALRPTLVSGTSAGKLADRTFMMTQGNLLDCSLDVAISSSVPGMTKCTLTRSVYGDDRKVVLLERGTELTGQYQGGMQQGQKRLFILWVRAKTPSGVVITLSSPGTDSLGRGGVDGFVDTHFWERFGAGLLLSVIDDVFQLGLAKVQNGSGGTRRSSCRRTRRRPQRAPRRSRSRAMSISRRRWRRTRAST